MLSTTKIRRGYVETTHGQVHYRTLGSGRALVLLHQTASASAMFETLMLELEGWRIALDTPGFGQSCRPETILTIPFCAGVLHEALLKVGVTECDVFGHHTGAAIAVQMAHSYSGFVRRLVLSGPPLLSTEQKANLAAGLQPFVIEENGAHLLAVWERLRRRDPALPLETVHRETLLTLSAGEYALQTYHAVFAQDFAGQLAALDIPVLVTAGEHDTLRASLEPAFAQLKHGQMHVIPNGTTYVCDREPQLVARLIREFLAMTEPI